MLKLKKIISKLFIGVFTLSLLCSFKIPTTDKQSNNKALSDSTSFSDATTLKVAYSELPGFFEYDSNNNEYGYGVDLLNKIGEYANIKFEYVACSSWSDTKQMLLDGRADIRLPSTMPSTSSTTLSYGKESIIDTYHCIMTLNTNNDLYYKDYDIFPTLKYGITLSLYQNTLKSYLDDLNIQESNLVFYSNVEDEKTALNSGSVNAIISNVMDLSSDLKVLARFDSVSNYIAMTLDNPYLDVIDNALHEIKMDNPVFIPNLYESYYPERVITPYTREEVSYVKELGTISVGMLRNRYPFSSIDDDGKVTGINENILDIVSERSGVKFSYEALDLNAKPITELKSKKYRMVAGIVATDNFKNDKDIVLTNSFSSTNISVVKRKNYTLDLNAKQTVVVKTSFQAIQDFIASNYPQYEVIYADTDEECLNAVKDKKADLCFQNVYVIDRLLQKPIYENLELLPTTFYTEKDCCAFSSDEDGLLISVINKAIKSLTTDEVNNIILAHTTANPYSYTFSDFFYKYRVEIIVLSVLILLITFLLITIIINRQKNVKAIEEKNNELAMALDSAEVASKTKGDFLAKMSHEIRTPMNAIIGLTTLASDHINEPEVVSDDLSKIELSSKMLLSIINDVLDMSSIEAGKMKINKAPFDLKTSISSASIIYYTQCVSKGVVFKTNLIGITQEEVIGDQLRLNQVLMNLLSNAYKFTKEGSIEFSVEQKLIKKDDVFYEFKIKDTGCGMTPEMLSRIFKPFEQESAGTAQKYGGSGLGLSIVKNLVTLMNGTISVQSKVNVGTTFIVNLPFKLIKGKEVLNTKTLDTLRVLAIDDEKDAKDYMEELLHRIGVKSTCVFSGEEGLKELQKARDENNPYNVCIVDWNMPNMNGIEFTKKARKLIDNDSVIIIASGYDYSESSEKAKDAGADMFVSKPLFQSTLFDLLMSLSNGKLTKNMKQNISYDFEGKRLLLAEDNEINREVAVGLLKKGNFLVDTARDGKEAVDMFKLHKDGYYDAILMDIQMPNMNGYEATKAIRELDKKSAKTIPIIAMTANAFNEDISNAISAGMNDHISKPIDVNLMFITIGKYINGGNK